MFFLFFYIYTTTSWVTHTLAQPLKGEPSIPLYLARYRNCLLYDHNKTVLKMFPSRVGHRTAVLLLTRCFQQQQQLQCQRKLTAARFIRTETSIAGFHSAAGGSRIDGRSNRRFVSVATGSTCIKMTGGVKKYQTVERGAPNSTDYRVFFSE